MLLADVGDDAAEVGPVVAEQVIAVFDLLGRTTVDELARRLSSSPGTTGGATSGQDPGVTHRGPVFALEDEPPLAPVLQGAAHPVGVLLVGLGPDD